MNCNKINYFNNQGYIINNNRYKSDILKKLKEIYNIDPFNFQEKSYSENLLNTILNKETLVCFIATNRNFIMYLTTMYNENVLFMISTIPNNDSPLPKILCFPFSFSNSLYTDTIFIGEMVNIDNNWTYLLEKCLVYKGRDITYKYMVENLQIMTDILCNKFKPCMLDGFDIRIKQYMTLNNIEKNITNCQYQVYGIKFYTLKKPIIFYFNTNFYNKPDNKLALLPDIDNQQYKKEIDKILNNVEHDNDIDYLLDMIEFDNTIDKNRVFILEMRPSDTYGIYNMYGEGNSENYLGKSRIVTIEMAQEVKESIKKTNKCIVETRYNIDFGKFEIIKITNNTNLSNSLEVDEYLKQIEKFPKSDYLAL